MSTLTFDTLKFANQLKTAGIPAVHAEAEAKALSEVLETNLGELATKSDLREVKADLREVETKLESRIDKTESTLRQEITNLGAKMADLKFELLKWMIGLLVAQTTLLLALFKFFPMNS